MVGLGEFDCLPINVVADKEKPQSAHDLFSLEEGHENSQERVQTPTPDKCRCLLLHRLGKFARRLLHEFDAVPDHASQRRVY